MSAPTKVARHTAFNFLTIAITSLLGVGVTALVARLLAPDRMGAYTLLVWGVGIAGLFANLGYVTATMKYMAEALGRDDPQEAAGMLAFSSRQVLLCGFAVSLLLAGIGPWAATAWGRPELAMGLAVGGASVIPMALLALYTAACQALQRYDQVAAVTGVTALASLTGTVLALWQGGGLAGLVGATGFASALGVLVYLVLLGRWQPGWWAAPLDGGLRRAMRKYQGPVFVMLVLDAVVWQRSEVFFLGAFSPTREVAFYGMAFSLATMAMKLIPGTLVGLLIPSMSRSMGQGDREGVGRIYQESCRYMAMLALPVAVGGALLAPALVAVLYGPGYEPVAGLLGALLGFNALVMVYGFPASSVLYSTDAQRLMVRIGLWVSALNLLLAWFLIPRYGAWGAVLANGLAQLASLYPGIRVAQAQTGAGAPIRSVLHLLLASVGMGGPVYAAVRFCPPLLALVVGPVLGVLTFALILWLTGAVTPADRLALRAIASKVPGLRGRFGPAPEA
ncbi:colanic acid exporter [compost metagenome]